jgi:ubiquinone/menaquinone biosynthesis C-methylase UbiE
MKMRKYPSTHDAFSAHFSFPGLTVIDVGCGNGDTARWLAAQGARVTGLDGPDMLARAVAAPPVPGATYVPGSAQSLPFAGASADLILYQASFHHVPPMEMEPALAECRRVLKEGGRAVFVEPVYRPGAYTEVTRLVEEESAAQERAYAAIGAQAALGLAMEAEEFFFLERSFADYERLAAFFVADPGRRSGIVAQARKITEGFSAAEGVAFDQFRYRSICRLNILRKGSS